MFVPFFERTSAALPVSMLAEVRSGSLSQPSGDLMRDLLTRDLLARRRRPARRPTARCDNVSPTRGGRRWTCWFLVEPQPMRALRHGRASIASNPRGSACRALRCGYPPYFAAVRRPRPHLRAVAGCDRARSSTSARFRPPSTGWARRAWPTTPRDGCVDRDLQVPRARESLRALDLGLPVRVERESDADAGRACACGSAIIWAKQADKTLDRARARRLAARALTSPAAAGPGGILEAHGYRQLSPQLPRQDRGRRAARPGEHAGRLEAEADSAHRPHLQLHFRLRRALHDVQQLEARATAKRT